MSNPFKYRYPGVKPFETAERDLFFGRDRDTEDLLDLLWLEKLVVLFGKSGYGKSSLINAGLWPALEKEAVPIIVRFGSYVPSQTMRPLDQLRKRINEVIIDNPDSNVLNLEQLQGFDSLWGLIKRKQSQRQTRFVFIFDQFEEFFTYPLPDQVAFKEQLAELLYTEVPQIVRDQTESFNTEQQAFIASAFDAKVLLAIRSDRMSLLDSMKDKLPTILQKRYELRGLSKEQARDAIEKPAMAKVIGNTKFASLPFTYSSDALRLIIDKLSETKVSQRTGIEAFQLQILCEYMESEVIAEHIPNNCIETHHFIEKINGIYEGYYQRLIDKLDPKVQKAAEMLIEEGLIYEDEKTGESRRLSVDADVLVQRFGENGISHQVLFELENQFLLRREATSMGGFSYEVSHDTLIVPILQSKSERKAREEAEKERRENRRNQLRLLFFLVLFLLQRFQLAHIQGQLISLPSRKKLSFKQ